MPVKASHRAGPTQTTFTCVTNRVYEKEVSLSQDSLQGKSLEVTQRFVSDLPHKGLL